MNIPEQNGWWSRLDRSSLAMVFTVKELEKIITPETWSELDEAILDVTCLVRESIAQNRTNPNPPDFSLIPRSLRPCALDILALRLLKRFALPVTDERKAAADRAEQILASVRDCSLSIIAPDGKIGGESSSRPAIHSPGMGTGTAVKGIWNVPNN